MEITATSILAANGLPYALENSSTPGWVICIVLLILSSVSWAVMITKMIRLRTARRENARYIAHFRETRAPMALFEEQYRQPDAPVDPVYRAGARELAFRLLGDTEIDENFRARLRTAGRLRPSQMETVNHAMSRAVGESVSLLESKMSLLATAVSGAPFLGLLGTVWGVMDTFGSVASAEGVASLKTMAPGVSAALVTTVVALLVAIPAMFGYNFLVNSIRRLTIEIDHFRTELRNRMDRAFVQHDDAQATGAVSGALPAPAQEPAKPAVAAVPAKAIQPQPAPRPDPTPISSHKIVKRTPEDGDPEFDFDGIGAVQPQT